MVFPWSRKVTAWIKVLHLRRNAVEMMHSHSNFLTIPKTHNAYKSATWRHILGVYLLLDSPEHCGCRYEMGIVVEDERLADRLILYHLLDVVRYLALTDAVRMKSRTLSSDDDFVTLLF
jgi:hypothetical protein